MLLGDGLTYAESKIKGADYLFAMLGVSSGELDLSGMSCRWDRIKPPENLFEVVSLLVISKAGSQATIFRKVVEVIDSIYGDPQNRKPISVGKLKLKATLAKVSLEMHVRMGGFRPFYLMATWLTALSAHLYFKTKKGKVYLNELVDMSDTLVIDGKINTVISGTPQQRKMLIESLDKLESEGEILYGLYVSDESIMSCYVRSMNERHIHFVDGAEGGYTKAANIIKQKNAFREVVH